MSMSTNESVVNSSSRRQGSSELRRERERERARENRRNYKEQRANEQERARQRRQRTSEEQPEKEQERARKNRQNSSEEQREKEQERARQTGRKAAKNNNNSKHCKNLYVGSVGVSLQRVAYSLPILLCWFEILALQNLLQAAQAPDKITRERDSIEHYNGLNL